MSRPVVHQRFADQPQTPATSASNVVVLAGGKGGVGTSSLTALMGLGLARAGRRVLLVDCGKGSLPLLLGLNPDGGAHTTPTKTSQLPLEWIDSGLAVLLGSRAGSGRDNRVAAKRNSVLSQAMALQADFDWVLLDAGTGLESVLSACSIGPDRLVAVTDAGRIALSETFGLLRGVSARLPQLPMQLVVNRERPESLRRVDGSIRAALQNFHKGPVETAGLVPFDPRLEGFTRGAGLIQDLEATSPAARASLRLGLTIALGPISTAPASTATTPITIAAPHTPALAPTGS